MDLKEFIHKEVNKLIEESRFGKRRSRNYKLEAEIDAYSGFLEKSYKIYAIMEVEPSEPATMEYPGSPGESETTIYKAVSEDGEVTEGEENIKALFTDEDWLEINKDLEQEFEKQVDNYDDGPDPDDIRDIRRDMNLGEEPHHGLEEFIQEEILKLHNNFLLESEKEMVEKQLKFLKEDEFFGDEGPQPGDVEYHYPKPTLLKGIGSFEDVDWEVLHEELIKNTRNNEQYAPGAFSSMFISKSDIVGNELSREEYEMLEEGELFETFDFYPIIVSKEYLDFNNFYEKAKMIWNNPPKTMGSKYDSETPFLRGREPMSEDSGLKTASGNPLDGRSKQSAINYIYKIFKQIDHGQRYKDTAWENVHKIFNLFGKYEMDTYGGYDAEYNPGGINVDEMTPQWKKWYYDFNFKDNKGISRTLTFILTAHAGGTVQDPWDSYDITFYPVNYKIKEN